MIVSTINRTIAKYYMLSRGDTVAVGVSGGADSMCLLHYLLSVREQWQLRLIVLHVEHGIRGEASVRDAAFVKAFCEQNNLPFRGIAVDVPAEAVKRGKGIEETARELRYAFFESVEADKIATAHNASDNVETLLFRLVRGTGLKGACGIPPVRGRIIRPLIDCTGEDIRRYCHENHIPYMLDETNGDSRYARNYLRNAVIPALKQLNPSFEEAGARFIRSAAEADAFLDKEAERLWYQCEHHGVLTLDRLHRADVALAKRVLIKWLAQHGLTADELHLEGVYALSQRQGKYQLKNRFFAVSDGRELRLAVFEQDSLGAPLSVTVEYMSLQRWFDHPERHREVDIVCDADRVCGEPTVRFRREGDTICPAGRGVTKTLKKLYNEAKIPVERRATWPVLADDLGVIGVAGVCVDERVKITGDTERVFLVKILTEDKHS